MRLAGIGGQWQWPVLKETNNVTPLCVGLNNVAVNVSSRFCAISTLLLVLIIRFLAVMSGILNTLCCIISFHTYLKHIGVYMRARPRCLRSHGSLSDNMNPLLVNDGLKGAWVTITSQQMSTLQRNGLFEEKLLSWKLTLEIRQNRELISA